MGETFFSNDDVKVIRNFLQTIEGATEVSCHYECRMTTNDKNKIQDIVRANPNYRGLPCLIG